jgi:Zn-dependent peptidase ImmA (M78 family)
MVRHLTNVPANAEAIRWARLQAKLSIDAVIEASRLSKLNLDRVGKIESGEAEATISEVLEFSRIYKRPFALFFLPQAPSPVPAIPDKRIGSGYGSDADGDLSLAIGRAFEVQEFLSELSASLDTPLPDIPTPESGDKINPENLAFWAREQLGVTKVFGSGRQKPEVVLADWIARVEALGIIVLQETFSPKDASAFSIGSLNPPVLVLCFKDAERRRLFSLFHELAHIVLRQSAICNLSYEKAQHDERFCDKFAASLLMPADEVHHLRGRSGGDLDWLAETISSLSGASTESAFLRLVDLHIATISDYLRRKPSWEEAYNAWLLQQKMKKGGPNPNPVGTAIKKGGRTLANYVTDAFQAGQISRADASQIIRLPAGEIPNLIRRIK